MYKKTVFSIVMALLCLSFTSYGQSGTSGLQAVELGEAVPDSLLDKPLEVINGPNGRKITTLRSYKGKLIILDFWATWCGACVSAFPKLDSLQKLFPGSLKILLVNSQNTGDSPEKVKTLLERSRHSGYELSSLVKDTVLSRLFRHQMIPHYVWLRNDTVLATTSSSELSAEHIRSVLNFGVFKPDIKKDVLDFDLDKPLFFGGNGGTGDQILYRSQISGAISGIASQTLATKNKSGMIQRYCCLNASRIDLFRLAYNAMSIPRNRIYIMSDSLNILQRKTEESPNFCFELICPPSSIDVVKSRMRMQLEQYFGWSVALEEKRVTCLVLKDVGYRKFDSGLPVGYLFDSQETRNYIRGQQLSLLINHLNQKLSLPLLDESGFSTPVNLDLPQDLTNLPALKACLEKQGLSLTEQLRTLAVLVFRPVNKL
ncbi:TlpA disulfide reductase family protein [Pedobacter sp.]|jgi:thiol-disulfide isomerase/thioredoxin|uniref:TlpA family protein disulfide reductase n=1 Tax=Pedobacter sp. TaxID=1411316 RepID=UPI002CEAA956|nr:TlpA disulfide reductase family protein [Pedobacter sp.]HWW41963.1 TlpA disulfide reductase family protein [Pedobacter sp.]